MSVMKANEQKMCFFYRFSWIKWFLMKDFFKQGNLCHRCQRVTSLEDAKSKGVDKESTLYFWGKKIDAKLLNWARQQDVEVRFVEDGFIRSLGLGSALSRPLSLVMDSRGIYFDPTGPSDLEHILQTQEFDDKTLNQAEKLIERIKTLKLSKYNHQVDLAGLNILNRPGQTVILVPGQVDDDMSVKFGAFGLNNLSLLQRVREANPDAYIIYKPHPDVLSKNRVGDRPDDVWLEFADQVIREAGIDSVLALVDEVHTMTSLVGFDALLRGKTVFTYGLPFYADWGLTTDSHRCERRTRKLNLLELVAGALILYPRYLDPETKAQVSAFEVLEYIAKERERIQCSKLKRTQLKLQGWILPRIRNFLKCFMR